jgi:hypothetical protein
MNSSEKKNQVRYCFKPNFLVYILKENGDKIVQNLENLSRRTDVLIN